MGGATQSVFNTEPEQQEIRVSYCVLRLPAGARHFYSRENRSNTHRALGISSKKSLYEVIGGCQVYHFRPPESVTYLDCSNGHSSETGVPCFRDWTEALPQPMWVSGKNDMYMSCSGIVPDCTPETCVVGLLCVHAISRSSPCSGLHPFLELEVRVLTSP